MKKAAIILLILFTLTSWKVDKRGPWIKTEGERVILYTRPLNYTKTNSPDSLAIQKIIQEQEQVIDFINERLKTDFNLKVKIFLCNFDEAKEKIGTNGGGSASLTKRHIYFAFFNEPIFNAERNQYEYVGVHEMVHVITINKLGRIRSSFFGEGYSNAIDGHYGSMMQENRLVRRTNESTLVKIKAHGRLARPLDLLYNDTLSAREYYPQIGCLVDWLFKTYGVENINKLYSLKKDKIEKRFIDATGDTFDEMGKRYMKYQQNI